MFDNLKRDLFVYRTNLHVAYNNFVLKQSFRPRPLIPKKVVNATIVALLTVSITSIVWSNRVQINESATATWQAMRSTATFVSEKSVLAFNASKNSIVWIYDSTTTFVSNTNLLIGESVASIQESFESKTPNIVEKKESLPKPEPEKELEKLVVAPPEPPVTPLPEKYAVAVDKKAKKLFILKELREHFEVVNSFDVSLGKRDGRKEVQGDLKTPVGLYHVTQIIKENLGDIYGPRAFVLNYPNNYDKKVGRTGGGIWLHGTGIGERTPDTKGCVELTDKNIVDLDQWVFENTAVAIFPEEMTLPVKGGKLDKHYLTESFFYEGDSPAFKPVASKSQTQTSQLN